jgi:hypothetical protein
MDGRLRIVGTSNMILAVFFGMAIPFYAVNFGCLQQMMSRQAIR